MSWEASYKADIGLFRELQNASISGDQVVKGEINGYMQIISTGDTAKVPPGPLVVVQGHSGSLGINEIEPGQTRNLFGFALKQNGVFTHKYAVCRCTGITIITTQGNINRYYRIKWAIYDEINQTYTDIVSYGVDAGLGKSGQIEWNNVNCYCVYKFEKMTQWGHEQTILYGGLFSYSNDSSNYGTQYIGKNVGMQGIGVLQHLSGYDEPTPEEVVFSPEYGDESEEGGYDGGSFDDTSDEIAMDSKPSIGVTTAGFINVYKVTQNDLLNLGEKLFPHIHAPEFLDDPQNISVTEMLSTFVSVLYGAVLFPVGTSAKLLNDIGIVDVIMNGKLIDYVIDCHIIPCSISGATVEGLKVGYRQFNDIQLARATEDYVDVDCGSLSIREYFKNFLDFASCDCQLWLPFVGYVPIDNEYWNGGTIQVKYRFNIVDGSFQANVISTSGKSNLANTIIAQYGGVACVHYPITGMQYANVISGLVNGTANAVVSGMGGNYAGVATSLMNMAMLRPENPSSNGYSASSSFLSKRTPYLIIKRPSTQFSRNYPAEKGLPLNVYKSLASVHGFTVIDNPVLNISCNDDEYNEICNLLKTGVIF